MLFVIVIGCSSPAHKNEITVSNEIVSANITNMPLVEVLASLESALQQSDSRYSIFVSGASSWSHTREIIEYPFTKHQKIYTAPNMPLISFSSNYCTVESFLKELEKQSAWCMRLDRTNDHFIIMGHLPDE
jgi:transcriptional regulator of heat shock response